MKLKKLKTLNEAIAEISDTDQGVVGIVYADAIRETKQKREMIDKAFKDRKIEMPNEDRFAHQKVNATKEMKKMQLAESLFTEWLSSDKDSLDIELVYKELGSKITADDVKKSIEFIEEYIDKQEKGIFTNMDLLAAFYDDLSDVGDSQEGVKAAKEYQAKTPKNHQLIGDIIGKLKEHDKIPADIDKLDILKQLLAYMKNKPSVNEQFDTSKDSLTEAFAQPDFALSEDQYILDDKSGNIEVNKDIFSDYIKDGRVNILFVDEEEDGEDKVIEYKMISEDDSTITFEYVGIATPGIDEEIADCQKYPIEKPKAKDSTYVSADDKQPKNAVKAKDSQFVSAGDKQPEKAAMKESFTNYDKTINRIKTIFAHKDWSEVKKGIEKSDAGKKQIKDYFNKNGLTDYANLLDKVTIYLIGDPRVVGYAKPDDNSITLNRELDIDSVAEVVKHELDNLNKNSLKEAFTNWDSPESRVERYFTDLPGMIITLQDHYDAGRIAADELAKALKVAYDALDSVPQMDEALEASQKYPIEKPKAKNSQFISAGDKQPSTTIDAKDSQFVSAGDKDPNKANKKLVKESMLVEEDEEESEEKGTFVYKNKREPLGDLIQVELTEGEWGYVKYPDGRLSPTRLPSANYLDDRIGADWDKNDRYAITVLGESAEDLQKAIDIAVKYGKEYRIEQLTRPIRDMKVRIWIYVDEEKDFDEPYFDPNVETVAGKKEDEALEASQKYPVKSPVKKRDSEFISKEDKYPVESPITEDFDDDLGDDLREIRITTEGLGNFHPYGEEAKATWDIIESNDKVATFEFMLEDMFPNGVGSNQLNDLLKSERDWILNMLNISDTDEVEETETLETSYSEVDDDFDM